MKQVARVGDGLEYEHQYEHEYEYGDMNKWPNGGGVGKVGLGLCLLRWLLVMYSPNQ